MVICIDQSPFMLLDFQPRPAIGAVAVVKTKCLSLFDILVAGST